MSYWRFLKRFGGDETAQDAVEYALLIGFVVVASAAGIELVLDAIQALWNALNAQLSDPG